MKHKNMPAAVHTADDSGVFEAIVSVFNNKDFMGDIVRPGAFVDSISAWKSAGDPIPIYWSHKLDDPHANIGAVEDIREISGGDDTIPDWCSDFVKANGGLYVKGRLDDFGLATQVRYLMKNRRVKQFSYTYDVLDEKITDEGNELRKMWLHEVGPTPLGANPLTELISAKSAEPDPPPDIETPPAKRRSSALFLRHQCDIALWEHHLSD